MFKIEDATDPKAFDRKRVKRVFTIEATEAEFDRLSAIMLAADPMTLDYEDEGIWDQFVRAFDIACCW